MSLVWITFVMIQWCYIFLHATRVPLFLRVQTRGPDQIIAVHKPIRLFCKIQIIRSEIVCEMHLRYTISYCGVSNKNDYVKEIVYYQFY